MKSCNCILLLPAWLIFITCAPAPAMDVASGYRVATTGLKLVCRLPAQLSESSGLIWYDSLLWTMNDSGGQPVVYGFDPFSCKICRRIQLLGVKNIDWEEICQDDSTIYIGDFGNNSGDRKDLAVYSISKKQLSQDSVMYAIPEKISYQYGDQEDFSPHFLRTPFDCEACISVGDSLCLFSKDWAHERSTVYWLDKRPGCYTLQTFSALRVDGLITGATIDRSGKWIYLCGYEDLMPFVTAIRVNELIAGKKCRVHKRMYTAHTGTQIEAICPGPGGSLFLTCESSIVPASLFKLEWHN